MTTDLEALARSIVAHAATQGTTRTKLAQGVLDLSARNAELERENGAIRINLVAPTVQELLKQCTQKDEEIIRLKREVNEYAIREFKAQGGCRSEVLVRTYRPPCPEVEEA